MMDPIVYGWIGRGRVAITGAITIDGTYRGLTVDVTSGTFSIAFTAAATLGSGYHVAIYNSGSGVVTLNPNASEPIRFPDGSAVTKTLAQGQGCVLACTGTGWEAIAGAGLNTATTVTGSGTLNRLAMFTATGSTIGDSTIANGSITGVLTFSKTGTTARTATFPDVASMTVTVLEGTQTDTGVKLYTGGSVGTPSPAIGTATNGFYAPAANQVGLSINGTQRFQWDATRFTISNSATAIASLPAAPSTTLFRISGADGVLVRTLYESYGQSMRHIFRRAETGAGAPSALTSGNIILAFHVIGYGATAYSSEIQGYQIIANEAWSDTATGIRHDWFCQANGSAGSGTNRMRLLDDGSLQVRTTPGTTGAGVGQLMARGLQTDQQTVSTTGNIVAAASDTGVVSLTGAAPVFQGIAAPTLGSRWIKYRVGTALTVNHQDAAATATDRIITSTGAAVVFTANQTARLYYDSTATRWILES